MDVCVWAVFADKADAVGLRSDRVSHAGRGEGGDRRCERREVAGADGECGLCVCTAAAV